MGDRQASDSRPLASPIACAEVLHQRMPEDVQISPDGGYVAFVVWESLPGEEVQHQRIWIAEGGSGYAQPLPGGRIDACSPRWSPDGSWLAFLVSSSEEGNQTGLYLLQVNSNQPVLLCVLPGEGTHLAWSPDGSRMSFLMLEKQTHANDPRVITPEPHRRLWTIRREQTIPEALTPHNLSIWEYAWAPDSSQLAVYYSSRPGSDGWYYGQAGLVAASGGAIRQLVDLQGWQARAFAWSPDGQRLCYIGGRWSDPGRGCGDLFAVTLSNGEVVHLTPNLPCSPAWSSWLPDKRHILYTAVKGVTNQISLLDTETGTSTLIEADFVMQGDQPALTLNANAQICATIHSSSTQPPDIWVGQIAYREMRPAAIAWRQLSRLNPLLEETVSLHPAERISYPGVDGWTVSGLFSPPARSITDAQLPSLYVALHGGPSAADCDQWYAFPHLFTSRGFAVFQPNMRGSWGQGAAFADAVLGDMGGKDFQDILAGVNYLVRTGKVDEKRIFIGGWSNGGFLSAWAVTQTSRFRAAIVGSGVTDWHNMHAQTSIPSADSLLLAANPLERPEVYRERSPITFAGRITTPTLILHGEDDELVPVAQAYALHRALVERKVPTELVIYPREEHGLIERTHLFDALERMMHWLERFL